MKITGWQLVLMVLVVLSMGALIGITLYQTWIIPDDTTITVKTYTVERAETNPVDSMINYVIMDGNDTSHAGTCIYLHTDVILYPKQVLELKCDQRIQAPKHRVK
jgi:hypothetical protein